MIGALLVAAVLTGSKPTVVLGPKQAQVVSVIRHASSRFVDVEGALRSAKTWSILIGLRMVLQEHPGIHIAIGRWTRGELNQKLIPDYRHVCELMGAPHGVWNASEQAYDVPVMRPDGAIVSSRVYCVHLKTSQRDNRFAALRGLTVAMFYVSQLEEVPEDVADEAMLRVSQPGYPQMFIGDANPVPEHHWIATRFPDTATREARPQHRYIRLAMRDNAHNLDASTIEAAEALYPVGHPLRAVKIEGRRGIDVSGTPVYLKAFDANRHVVDDLTLNPELPLLEWYDYGFHHPCVVWGQYAPWGWLRVLGGVLGSDLHLDAFLPLVEKYRELWFPKTTRGDLDAACDPAGAAENSQGMRGTPVELLRDWYREHGERDADGEFVSPTFLKDANHPERRYAANQKAATYMRRQVNGAEAFLVDRERWVVAELQREHYQGFFVEALGGAYVLEDTPRRSDRLGSFYVPKKDGFYEHPMNCFEYGLQAHVLDLPLGNTRAAEAKLRHEQARARAAVRALEKAQRDKDPDDIGQKPRGMRRAFSRRSFRRGGY